MGFFMTFEGGEGTGKSTQIDSFRSNLFDLVSEDRVLFLREPGGTIIGEQIRGVLLDIKNTGMVECAELMLYEAARTQLVEERIKPALENGMIVVSDRFYDSTTAYQGHARGLNLNDIRFLNRMAVQGCHPDLTILLSLDSGKALKRATTEGADRIEQEGKDFHQRVHEGFLAIATAEPERVVVIDASGTVEAIAKEIWKVFLKRYNEAQDILHGSLC